MEQRRNTRTNRLLTHNGKTMSVAEWSEVAGINKSTLSKRVNAYGWSVGRALTEPVRRRRG